MLFTIKIFVITFVLSGVYLLAAKLARKAKPQFVYNEVGDRRVIAVASDVARAEITPGIPGTKGNGLLQVTEARVFRADDPLTYALEPRRLDQTLFVPGVNDSILPESHQKRMFPHMQDGLRKSFIDLLNRAPQDPWSRFVRWYLHPAGSLRNYRLSAMSAAAAIISGFILFFTLLITLNERSTVSVTYVADGSVQQVIGKRSEVSTGRFVFDAQRDVAIVQVKKIMPLGGGQCVLLVSSYPNDLPFEYEALRAATSLEPKVGDFLGRRSVIIETHSNADEEVARYAISLEEVEKLVTEAGFMKIDHFSGQ